MRTYPIKPEIYARLKAEAETYGGVGAGALFINDEGTSIRATNPEHIKGQPYCLHGMAIKAGLETYREAYPENDPVWDYISPIGLPDWRVIDRAIGYTDAGSDGPPRRIPFDEACARVGIVQAED